MAPNTSTSCDSSAKRYHFQYDLSCLRNISICQLNSCLHSLCGLYTSEHFESGLRSPDDFSGVDHRDLDVMFHCKLVPPNRLPETPEERERRSDIRRARTGCPVKMSHEIVVGHVGTSAGPDNFHRLGSTMHRPYSGNRWDTRHAHASAQTKVRDSSFAV